MTISLSQNEACIIVDPAKDNVAICKSYLNNGTKISLDNAELILKQPVSKGQRFALRDIPSGKPVVQYGSPFGLSTDIEAGELIHPGNIRNIQIDLSQEIGCYPPETTYREEWVTKTFAGYKRVDGGVGTRNYYLLVPTSQCPSQTVVQLASEASSMYQLSSDFPNVDGIVAIPNTEGCGCASNIQIDRFLRVLQNFINHPNVGGLLIVDLGCEQTNISALNSYLKKNEALPYIPTDWLTIQEQGGTQNTISKALEIIGLRLPEVNDVSRTPCPIGNLVVGTECGASDGFSGITANPVIGNMVDKVISGKGGAILSEVPEMVGAEHLLIQRMRSREVVSEFKTIMNWYRDLSEALGVDMSDNLVPENRAAGLINPCLKSLGAITKGGTGAIEGILDYGERLSQRGLHVMQGPGNDIESVTGMVASGANIVCFSTGKGTVTGSAITPVIKISSTTELYERLPEDIDFDAGEVLNGDNIVTLEQLGEALFDLVITVASGKQTKSEKNKQGQFQVWTAGKLPL